MKSGQNWARGGEIPSRLVGRLKCARKDAKELQANQCQIRRWTTFELNILHKHYEQLSL